MNQLFLLLNRIAISAMKRSEVVGAAFVIAIVFMMIIPLPTGLVDVLIAINISLSSLLIALAMYLPGPLAFSSFPAVLLLTTMFRLALSISTTRLILLEQDAGHIVEAFGNFVVGGNLAVGLVIFLILTVVNFLVITKGSERVAEVAARFTLDAMPGKQMSIDSDLRAGLIDARDARFRREQLGKESQLFGAMDGAMKFVKGDAIAGLVIVSINLIGGFAVGTLQHDMTAAESMHLYSVLTIGDGLIAQIPALLISLTAGMIITRVAPDNQALDANIGREMAEQITSQPKAWIIASFGMLGFALLPGMPTTIFTILASLSLASGIFQLFKAKRIQQMREANRISADTPPEMNGDEDIRRFNPARAYMLQFHPCRSTPNDPFTVELIRLSRRCRNRIVNQYGITLPSFDIDYNEELAEDEFRFCVYEVPTLKATYAPDRVAIDRSLLSEQQQAEGEEGRLDRDEERWFWYPASHALAQAAELNPITPTTLVIERLERLFFATGPQFIGLQEAKAILSWVEAEQPELAQELQRVVPTSRFAAVLQRLAAESIPLRAIRPIAEALIEHGQYERDVGALTDFIRISLKAQICHQYSTQTGMHVWLLTPETEELLRDSLRQTQTESFFALSQEASHMLVQQLREAFPVLAAPKPILLVAQDLRRILRNLLQDEFNHVPVLSFSELQSTSQVNVLGRISLEA
ncbi:EscV/YscV/HrcV family type III secretion system export apparatus protein [Pokkaliibacter plantistimulans]|uniref:EscV/YscV/HrcV family type III secretion system export apparatus protein n=1 Tax=Proteobacteria bacterium 228 TaxID=2083153 RepID=A0A2S5KQV6_9PROT|nr:type III secretion system export apparatus subunit SctV [Pokkaliibacter plantistimulans]PPC77035.1 EscV/YscV/HrcV family type III secretion system export apparatus protein [Pokkaliibacter plantistimulans]